MDKHGHFLVIQERLTEVRSSIESYESQLRTYKNLVSYSTIYLSIKEVERDTLTAELSAWQQISTNFAANLKGIGHGIRAFFILFIGYLPNILLAAAIAASVIYIFRLWKKKRKEKPAVTYRPADRSHKFKYNRPVPESCNKGKRFEQDWDESENKAEENPDIKADDKSEEQDV